MLSTPARRHIGARTESRLSRRCSLGRETRTTEHPPGSFVVWLLIRLSTGQKLTQTRALNRALVRDTVVERPGWWDEEFRGKPNRESDVPVLELLHWLLLEFKLVRRFKGELVLTPTGRKLLTDLLRAEDDGPAATLCANILREVLIGMGAGSLEELVAVTACKIGGSGNQLSFDQYVDVAADVAAAHGWDLGTDKFARWKFADPIHEVIWLMQGLDLCTYKSRDKSGLDRRLVFSPQGQQVIRDAGVRGRAEIVGFE